MNFINFKSYSTHSLGYFKYPNPTYLNSKLLKELSEIGWLRDDSGQSVRAGITESLLHHINKEGVRLLLDYVCSSLNSYSTNTEYCGSKDAQITDLWGVEYLKGEHTSPHKHHPNTLSFVYFVKSEKNDSPLVFCDSFFKFNGKSGDLLIFPAHLKHYVPVQKSKNKRTTIAGNIWFRGWYI